MANKINIEQIEEHLKQAGLDNGELENLLNPIKELNNQRRYGLVWEEPDNNTYGTDSAEQELLRNFPFLKEVNEHRIFNGEEHPDHLLIEGDNLHALKTMQYTHKNKIDVIYIDPPYNTGNTDFVYNDKFVDGEDSWRHSKWLSFMNKRLRLARELMTEDGVIFISIDDNELYQLKLQCDQIFGEENFISNMVWHNRNPNLGVISNDHEYVLVYARDVRKIKPVYKDLKGTWRGVEVNRNYINPDKDKRGEWRSGGHTTTKQQQHYSYSINVETGDTTEDKLEKYPYYYHEMWRYPKHSLTRLWKDNRLYWEVTKDKVKSFKVKKFKNEEVTRTSPQSVILKDFAKTNDGKTDLKQLGFDESVFSYPKPVKMVKHLVGMLKGDAITLDFFAGSGTTAQAVMELNKEDGGSRQAILVTNNEINTSEEEDFLVENGYVEQFTGSRRGTKKHAKWLESVNEFKETTEYKYLIETDEYKDLGIARAVTEQRINKVINGYTTPKGKEVEGLTDNNFYHFEVELEPDLKDMDLNTYVLVNKTKDIIRIKEGVYTKEEDISTETVPSVKLTGKDKEVIVVLSVRVTDSDIEELVNNFKYSEKEHVIYTSYTGFEYGINNIRFEELPKELLQAIKHEEGK